MPCLPPIENSLTGGKRSGERLAENVSLHRGNNLVARSVRTQIQLGVQREQFKRVVMVRSAAPAPGPMKPTLRPVLTI